MIKDFLIVTSACTLFDRFFIVPEARKIVGEIVLPEVMGIMYSIFKCNHAKLITGSMIRSQELECDRGVQRLGVTF